MVIVYLSRDGIWVADYSGSARPGSILAWARKKFGHGVKYLANKAELERSTGLYNKTAIGYFPSVNVDYIESLRLLDRTLFEVDFAYTCEVEIGRALGLEIDSILVTSLNESQIFSKNLDNPTELLKTMRLLTYPRMIKLDRFWIQDLIVSSFPLLLIYHLNDLLPAIDEPTLEAVRHSGFLLATVDCNSTESEFVKLSEYLGKSACSSLWIVEEPRSSDTVKHITQVEEISNEKILNFISQYSQRQLTPFVKSDPRELTSPHEARVVVGSEWSEFVSSDSPKLVLFYTPWCRYCTSAIEVTDQLATQDFMLVAKMDKSRNDCPGLPVDTFPSIVLIFPKSLPGHAKYTGPITVDAVTEWATALLNTPREEL
jgi:thiol-disulfide isomerase/thioredoxin